jgi:hypothetical protein
MKHRIHLAACLSALALAGVSAVPASANPGLLHKHGARTVGVPAMLPGQSPAGGVAAATAVAPPVAGAPSGAAASSIGVVTFVPGADGSVAAGVVVVGGPDGSVTFGSDGPGVAPGQPPICVMPNPGMIDSNAIDPGMIDSGMVMVDGPPPGFFGGGIDGNTIDGAGDMPVVLYAPFPPGSPGREGGGPGFAHQTMSASMTSAASASTSDVVGGSGRALAGGLPNRAAGVRTDALATVRHHGHRPMRVGGSTAEGVAVSGDDSSGSVVQAGGVAQESAGTVPHDRQAKLTASNVAGQAVIPPAATAAPRWRDRLRFAWPTTK